MIRKLAICIGAVCISLPTLLWAQGDQGVPDTSFIADFITAVGIQVGLGGWAVVVGLIGAVCMFSVRAIKILWPTWWNKLSPLGKFALPFLAAFVGTAVVGVAGALAAEIALGTVVAKLVGSAIAAGFAAVTMHEGSKQVGMTFDIAAVKNAPGYEPGNLRKNMSLVVGVPNMDEVRDKVIEVK